MIIEVGCGIAFKYEKRKKDSGDLKNDGENQ